MTTRTALMGSTTAPITIAAGATAVYKGQLQDENGTAVPSAQLASLTLSIVDTFSGAIVNSCSQVNILNTGRGTVDSSGNLAVTLGPSDTALLVATDQQEYRSMVLDWTYLGGAKTGRHQVDLLIQALTGP
jgi:hypothetical protein